MVAKHVNNKNAGKTRVLTLNVLLYSLAAPATTFSAMAFYWCKATNKVNLARIWCVMGYPPWNGWPRLRGLADWENRLGGSPHPSCKRNQSETRDYMDRRGGLPHLNGLPHLPGVPHLHDGKSLFTVGDIETLSLNAATSGNKTTHTSPFPLCSKLWCLLSSYCISKVAQHCIEGVGEGKIKLPFLSWQNVREVLGQGSQLILSQIVETLV